MDVSSDATICRAIHAVRRLSRDADTVAARRLLLDVERFLLALPSGDWAGGDALQNRAAGPGSTALRELALL